MSTESRSRLAELFCFPERNPHNCSRGCYCIYQAHTDVLSFAVYASKEPPEVSHVLCIRAFSCGSFYEGKREAQVDETMQTTIAAIIEHLVPQFCDNAEAEAKNGILWPKH